MEFCTVFFHRLKPTSTKVKIPGARARCLFGPDWRLAATTSFSVIFIHNYRLADA